jgi:hypothetical protein
MCGKESFKPKLVGGEENLQRLLPVSSMMTCRGELSGALSGDGGFMETFRVMEASLQCLLRSSVCSCHDGAEELSRLKQHHIPGEA